MLIEKCDDGYHRKDGLGYDKPCCPNGWLAAVVVGALDYHGDPTVQLMMSVRSNSDPATTFDLPLQVMFPVDDPDNPGTDINVIADGSIVLTTLTVGVDTSWVFKETLTGLTTPWFGSLGTPFMAAVPDLYVYLTSFIPDSTGPPFLEPIEYGIPIFSHDPGTVTYPDAQTSVLHSFTWEEGWDLVNDDLDPIDRLFGVISPFGGLDGSWTPQEGAYYDPPTHSLDVNPSSYPYGFGHFFTKAFFPTPKAKRTDELFDIEVDFQELYTGLKSEVYEVPVTEPYASLFFPIDDAILIIGSVIAAPGYEVGPYAKRWLLKDCQFLAQVGTHFIEAWANREPLLNLTIGLGEPWKTKSGPISVKVGAAVYWSAVYQTSTFDEPDHIPILSGPANKAANPLRDGLGNPIRVRILDTAGQRSGRYNIVPTSTALVTAVLTESDTNFLASPALTGYVDNQLAAIDGKASFDDLTVHGLGRYYRITFTAPSPLVPYLDVVHLSISTGLKFDNPGIVSAGVNFDVIVRLKDANDVTLAPTSADDLTLSGSGAFTGFGTQTPVSGIATFNGNFPAAGTYDIEVKTSLVNYDGPNDAGDIPSVHLIVIVV